MIPEFHSEGLQRFGTDPRSGDLVILPVETLTFSYAITGIEGDAVSVVGSPNRIRRYVGRKVTATVYEVLKFIRPSRGFARHNRRLKQQQRKNHARS